jgi:hypothetical protein
MAGGICEDRDIRISFMCLVKWQVAGQGGCEKGILKMVKNMCKLGNVREDVGVKG